MSKIESYIETVLESIPIIHKYDEFMPSRLLFKDMKLLLCSYHFINEIYIKYINGLNAEIFSNIILTSIYEKFSNNRNIKNVLGCVSTMNVRHDGLVQITIEKIDEEKKQYTNTRQYEFRSSHFQSLADDIIESVNNCDSRYKVIDLVITDKNNFSHDTSLIFEKTESKILIHFYDPQGFAYKSNFSFINNILSEIIKYDESKVLDLVSVEQSFCPEGIQKFEEKIKLGGQGYCALFNFFFIYVSLCVCFKNDISFFENSKKIDEYLVNLFSKNSEYSINKMCNLVEQTFGPFIDDSNTNFMESIGKHQYQYNIHQEVELKQEDLQILQKIVIKKQDKLKLYQESKGAPLDKDDNSMIEMKDLQILKKKINILNKSNKTLDSNFRLVGNMINDSQSFIDNVDILNNTLEYYNCEYLMNRIDNDIELLRFKYFVNKVNN